MQNIPEELSPAFQFYPKDWLGSMRIAEMSLEEEGAYIRALCYCWKHKRIPSDPKRLARIIGKGCTEEVAGIAIAMFQKDEKNEGAIFHDRLEKERKKQEVHRAKRSIAGKKGAKSRWQSHSNANGNANATAMAKNGFSSSTPVEEEEASSGEEASSSRYKEISYEELMKDDE